MANLSWTSRYLNQLEGVDLRGVPDYKSKQHLETHNTRLIKNRILYNLPILKPK